MSRYDQRRHQLRKLVQEAGADAILISSFVNVTYLTGFTGDDSYLLVGERQDVLLSDSRYAEQLREECPGLDVEIRQTPTTMLQLIEQVTSQARIRRLAVEADSMTLGLYQSLVEKLADVPLHSTSGLVEQLREIKDEQEVAEIRFALELAERAFDTIKSSLDRQQTERLIAANMEHEIRQLGGRGCSFSPIVAVGPRAALPHAQVTDKKVGEADFVLIDWGATGRLYMCDLTRILVTGKITPELERIYGVVLSAQERAIAAIRPGAAMSEVDAAARQWIADAGYGDYFGHGLGHGFGLEVHERPRLAPAQDRPLQAGMVVTVEPGIYVPGWGGIRIEDDVLVTPEGHEVLSQVPKELADCVVAS